MTDAVQTVLHDWAVPRMKVRHMWVSAYTGNEGSVKVFLKNGFKIIKTIENHAEVKGKMRGLHLMEWKYGPENNM
jgi:RimJ/RimL family protein N-acetyltransferase